VKNSFCIPTIVNGRVIPIVLNKRACYLNDNNSESGGLASNTPHNVKLNGGKKVSNYLFGDSFLKGSAEIVRTILSEKCNVLSVIKLGADLKELTQSLKKEVLTLTSRDIIQTFFF
jgi:hypothetical protein